MRGMDSRYAADSSPVLRYFSLLFPEELRSHIEAASIREGIRLVEIEPYRQVRLSLLDETTCMHTGTYKSLDGCVTTAMARMRGLSRIVCSSGANAGRALTEYGRRLGLETFFFCPVSTLYKLPESSFCKPTSHLISVEGSDRRVKAAAKCFSELTSVPLVPELDWRILASGVRGMFLAEQTHAGKKRFDWLAQAVCAGFGPIGLYRALQKQVEEGILDRDEVPSFLGVQQAALSPIVDAWARGEEVLENAGQWKADAVIEPSLYNTQPAQTYPMLRRTLASVGGDVTAVQHREFQELSDEYLRRIEGAGIRLTRRENGEALEKAGLLAGVGVLKAVDEGRFRAGQHVLCSLTGGAAAPVSTAATPEFHIPLEADLTAIMENYIREFCDAGLFESIG